MMRYALALPILLAPFPGFASELGLMVGLRSVMAAAIRDEGYNCPDVKRIVELGPDKFGSVMKVVCGPVGRDESWDERPLRVTAYLEGDYTAKPWREHRIGTGLSRSERRLGVQER
jgi:hypothetical protein